MTKKNILGTAFLYPILGVVILGIVGFVVARRIVPKDGSKQKASQTNQQVQIGTNKLQNTSCELTLSYPEGWGVTLNSEEGGCKIGLKSPNVDAPFALLINETQADK